MSTKNKRAMVHKTLTVKDLTVNGKTMCSVCKTKESFPPQDLGGTYFFACKKCWEKIFKEFVNGTPALSGKSRPPLFKNLTLSKLFSFLNSNPQVGERQKFEAKYGVDAYALEVFLESHCFQKIPFVAYHPKGKDRSSHTVHSFATNIPVKHTNKKGAK